MTISGPVRPASRGRTQPDERAVEHRRPGQAPGPAGQRAGRCGSWAGRGVRRLAALAAPPSCCPTPASTPSRCRPGSRRAAGPRLSGDLRRHAGHRAAPPSCRCAARACSAGATPGCPCWSCWPPRRAPTRCTPPNVTAAAPGGRGHRGDHPVGAAADRLRAAAGHAPARQAAPGRAAARGAERARAEPPAPAPAMAALRRGYRRRKPTVPQAPEQAVADRRTAACRDGRGRRGRPRPRPGRSSPPRRPRQRRAGRRAAGDRAVPPHVELADPARRRGLALGLDHGG